MSNSSIWPMDRTLSGASTPVQSGPGSDVNEGTLRIPQSSIRLLSVGGGLPTLEMQSLYSTAPGGWTKNHCFKDDKQL